LADVAASPPLMGFFLWVGGSKEARQFNSPISYAIDEAAFGQFKSAAIIKSKSGRIGEGNQ
jgi:hypothetical protein